MSVVRGVLILNMWCTNRTRRIAWFPMGSASLPKIAPSADRKSLTTSTKAITFTNLTPENSFADYCAIKAMSSTPVVISVIGSLNVDLVTRTTRVPVAGETLASESFSIGWGGKGANQAVACARLSRTKAQANASQVSDVEVRMVGAVGEDEFHKSFLKALQDDGLNTDKVQVLPGRKTGVAVIVVETATGENRIMFNPGANGDVPVKDLVDADASVALFQLELPLQVVLHNMAIARKKGVETIINPAPAVELPAEAYQGLGHLIVNETEAAILSGIKSPSNWDEVAAIFITRGVNNVIITLGGDVSCQTRP
jgi:ribokinase